MRRVSRLLFLVTVSVFGGCPTEETNDQGTDTDAVPDESAETVDGVDEVDAALDISRDDGWVEDAAQDRETAADGDADGRAPEDTSPRDAADCDGIIMVDPPCRSVSRCVGTANFQGCRDAPCWEVVGHHCCGGVECRATGADACAAGTVCLERAFGLGFQAACLPPAPDSDADGGSDVDYDVWLPPTGWPSGCS